MRPDQWLILGLGLLAGATLAIGAALWIVRRTRSRARASTRRARIFERAQEMVRVGNWEWDLDTDQCRGSAEASRLYGLPSDGGPVSSERLLACVHHGERDSIRTAMQSVRDGAGSFDEEYHVQNDDGTVLALQVRGVVRRERGGRRVMVGTVQDVTETHAVRRSEERLRLLFEQSPLSIQIFSPDGLVLRVNRAWEELWGLSADALDSYNVLADRQLKRAGVLRCLRRAFDGETVTLPEIEYDPAKTPGVDGGRRRRVAADAYPILDRRGRVREVVLIHQDRTARREAEEENRRLELRIKDAQREESLGVLAGGVAHDFNNLLAGILGYAELARKTVPEDSAAADKISRIESSAIRASELTNQMLAYTGQGKQVVTSVDLSALVREMTHLLEISVSKSALIEYDFADEPTPLVGDATQIRQVIMNLLTNASEAIASPSGTIRVSTGRVQVDAAYLAGCRLADGLSPGEYVFCEVSDSGRGMDASTLERIFDPFFTTKFTGRGLGLAAVQGIVRGHRGAIRIDSQPQKGTTFRVAFPLAAVEGTDGDVFKPVPWGTEDATVLVVDDDETVRTVVREMLEGNGLTVVSAADGVEALELIEAGLAADLVLLDMTMPRLSGAETAHEMRERGCEIPVVVMSGFSEEEALARFSDDVHGFLQKPFQTVQLVHRVRAALTPQKAEADG